VLSWHWRQCTDVGGGGTQQSTRGGRWKGGGRRGECDKGERHAGGRGWGEGIELSYVKHLVKTMCAY